MGVFISLSVCATLGSGPLIMVAGPIVVLMTPACFTNNVELDNRLRWTSLGCSLSHTLVGEVQEEK